MTQLTGVMNDDIKRLKFWCELHGFNVDAKNPIKILL